MAQQIDPLDFEYWYPTLKEFTFKTSWIDLSRDEAQNITDAYDDLKHSGNKANKDVLQKLADRIDETIKTYANHATDGVFIKLSTRSAKDVVLRDPKSKQLLANEIEKSYSDNHGKDPVSNEVIAIIRMCSKAMRVHNGEEAVYMLGRSERIYQDLFGRLLQTNTEEEFQMKIVIREWVHIVPEYEFRGFVNEGKFNALTQYYKACYVADLAIRKDEIEQKVKQLFEILQPVIATIQPPITSYVVDFAFDANFEHVYMIELNHFGTTASSALFDWYADKQVMYNGPFEFRVLTQPVKDVKRTIAGPLRAMMNQVKPGWYEEEQKNTKANEKEQEKEKCIVQ